MSAPPRPRPLLQSYESAKFELAEILRALVAVGNSGAQAEELLAHLAEDRFNIVLVGRFTRGKTSLMNALLGTDRLPTGLLPLTSVITHVAYGSHERVQLELQDDPGFEIPMEALADYITERGNPGNTRRVRAAHICLPAQLMRGGLHLVDTPGLGSAILENTRTTEAFYNQADAVILVSGHDSPLSSDELEAIRSFAAGHQPLFIVLNKQDLVSASEREAALAYVRERLQPVFGLSLPPLFSISALAALAARLTGDRRGLADSGLPQLEQALTRFLVGQKHRLFLARMCERVSGLLEATASTADRASLRQRLLAVRERSTCEPSEEASAAAAGGLPGSAEPESSPIAMQDCLLCARVSDALYEFLRRYQHELTVNEHAREQLATAGGLCTRHLWLYASMANHRSICLALTPLMKRIGTALAGRGGTDAAPAGADTPGSRLADTGPRCSLCRMQEEVESAAFTELAALPAEGSACLEALPSVCLPHLRVLAERLNAGGSGTRGAAWLDALCLRQSAATRRLTEDMQRYVLKRDGLRQSLTTEEETQAAQRALAFLAGRRNGAPHT